MGFRRKRAAAKTSNGGINWLVNSVGTNDLILSADFISQDTGWVRSANGTILRTTNGGTNWISQRSGPPFISSITFINGNIGWAAGGGGLILKTVTSGLVSVNQTSENSDKQFSLYQNYPNPFNPETKINYELRITNYVKFVVLQFFRKDNICFGQ